MIDNEAIWTQAKKRLGLADLTPAEKAALLVPYQLVADMLDNE